MLRPGQSVAVVEAHEDGMAAQHRGVCNHLTEFVLCTCDEGGTVLTHGGILIFFINKIFR